MCTSLKTIVLSLFSIVFSVGLFSQDTIFIEDFQGGALDDFISLDLDQLPLSSAFAGLDGGFQVAPITSTSDLRAIAVSDFENGGTADNWLITPVIDLTAGGGLLSWTAASLSGVPAQLESYRVLLSRNGGSDLADFSDILTVVNNQSSIPEQRTLDLSPYGGLEVRIAFHQNGTDNYALTIDDILVTQPTDPLSAEIVEIVGDRYQHIPDSELIVRIQNTGTELIEQLSLDMEATNSQDEIFLLPRIELDNLMLRPQEILEITVPGTEDFEADRLDIDFYIVQLNSDSLSSLVEKRTFYFFETGAPQVWLYEELTSTTCPFCPQGIVDKQELKSLVGDQVVVLSVHTDDDPMVLPFYQLGFNNLAGSQGLPSAAINRSEFGLTTEVSRSATLQQSAQSALSLDLEHSYDVTTRTLDYTISGTAYTALDGDVHRLSFLLVEDGVTGSDSAYDQANNFSTEAASLPLVGPDGTDWQGLSDPVPASDMVYDDVVREAIGSFEGEIGSLGDMGPGETYEWSGQVVIPSTFDENNLRLVVLALDAETGQALQAYEEELEFSSAVSELAYDVKAYPNPALDRVVVELDRAMQVEGLQLEDYKGRILDPKHIAYTPDFQSVTIHRKGLSAGFYFLKIQLGQNVVPIRLLFVD